MGTDSETKKVPEKGENDHIWLGLFDGVAGLFTGTFSTRIGFGLFLFILGLLMILAPVQGNDLGAKIMLRSLGVGIIIGAAFLFRSGLREKRHERDESRSASPSIRRSPKSRRR